MTPREAKGVANALTHTLLRIARADDRTLATIAESAHVHAATLQRPTSLFTHSLRLSTIVALADTLGYQIVLKKKDNFYDQPKP